MLINDSKDLGTDYVDKSLISSRYIGITAPNIPSLQAIGNCTSNTFGGSLVEKGSYGLGTR